MLSNFHVTCVCCVAGLSRKLCLEQLDGLDQLSAAPGVPVGVSARSQESDTRSLHQSRARTAHVHTVRQLCHVRLGKLSHVSAVHVSPFTNINIHLLLLYFAQALGPGRRAK